MPKQNFSKIETLPEKDLKHIESLAKNGYSFKYIAQYLIDLKYDIDSEILKDWYKLIIPPTSKEPVKAAKNDTNDIEDFKDDPLALESIREGLGGKNIEKRLVYNLFMTLGILCQNRLNLYQQGLAKFPTEQIRSFKLLYDMNKDTFDFLDSDY